MSFTERLALLITADAGGAVRELGRVGQAAERDLGRATSGTERFASSAIATGSRMTVGLTLPVVAGFTAMGKAAADEGREMAVLEQALRNNTGATEDQVAAVEAWVTASQNATGISDGELRPALAKLVIAHGDVARAQQDMAVAMDIAVARGVSVEAVTTAMAKAADGNVGALGRLGLATKDASGETLSYDAILQQASQTMGGSAAAAADTTAGKLAITQAKFADLSETIGAAAIPVMERVAGVATSLADGFSKLDPAMQNVIIGSVGVVAAMGPVLKLAGNLAKATTGVSNFVTSLSSGVPAASGFASKLGVLVGAHLGPLAAGLGVATVALGLFINDQREAAQAVEEFRTAMEGAEDPLEAAKKYIIDQVLAHEGLVYAIDRGKTSMEELTGAIFGGKDATNQLVRELGVQEGYHKSASAVQDLGRAYREATTGIDRTREAYAAAGIETEEATETTETNTVAVEEAATATEALADELSDLNSAFDVTIGKNIGAQRATIELTEKVAGLTTTLGENGATLDLNTEAGRANRRAILDVAESAIASAQAYAEQTGDVEGARNQVALHTIALADQLRQAGLTEQQVRDYIDTIGLTPANIDTVFRATTTGAAAAIRDYQRLLLQTPSEIETRFRAIGMGAADIGALMGTKSLDGGKLADDAASVAAGVDRYNKSAGAGVHIDKLVQNITTAADPEAAGRSVMLHIKTAL